MSLPLNSQVSDQSSAGSSDEHTEPEVVTQAPPIDVQEPAKILELEERVV